MRRQKISDKFSELRKKGEGALICYIMAGDPTAEQTGEIVKALVNGGADIIELGFPFSDPVADGPTIQVAGQRALAAGMDTGRYFELVKALEVRIPLVCMTYYNPVFRYGVEKFVEQAADRRSVRVQWHRRQRNCQRAGSSSPEPRATEWASQYSASIARTKHPDFLPLPANLAASLQSQVP